MRWAEMLRNMSEADYAREFIHPETGNWTLEKALAFIRLAFAPSHRTHNVDQITNGLVILHSTFFIRH